jgi:hypothetical protein
MLAGRVRGSEPSEPISQPQGIGVETFDGPFQHEMDRRKGCYNYAHQVS